LTFLAVDRGDVSIAAPVLGIKVLVVPATAPFFVDEEPSTRIWIAAAIAVIGIVFVQVRDEAVDRAKVLASVGFALLAAFSMTLFDLLIQRWASAWGAGYFLPIAFGFAAVFSLAFARLADRPRELREKNAVRPLAIGAVLYFHDVPVLGLEDLGVIKLIPGFGIVILTMVLWWRDVVKESVVQKAHTEAVNQGLRFGMVLFIASEVMFFAAFFWAFFHNALGFSTDTLMWPPEGITPLDAWELPFYNTIILLTSGGTVTRAHLFIEEGNNKAAARWIFITAALGAIFLGLQVYAYIHAEFSLTDGIYPSTFYLATGFHGFHVFVGTVFLIVCGFRAAKGHFSPHKHVGFQAAAWYWHFVDVVWLFLFVWGYWLLGLPVRTFGG